MSTARTMVEYTERDYAARVVVCQYDEDWHHEPPAAANGREPGNPSLLAFLCVSTRNSLTNRNAPNLQKVNDRHHSYPKLKRGGPSFAFFALRSLVDESAKIAAPDHFMPPTPHSHEMAESGFPLNAEQRAAVEHGEGPLLVVAGAGTGKTRVITERIRNLLESDPTLAGENILGLTFTNKAAGEMKSRVVKAAGERAEAVWLSTFHKFCLEKILQGVNPDIQSLDDLDHRILMRRNIADLGLVLFRRLAEPAEFLKDFQSFFSRCQDELVTPDDYQRYVDTLRREHDARKKAYEPDALAIAEEEVARQEELARVYRVSERLLRERNLYTFGAQLLQSVELLRSDAALLARMREQYRYILVDEFQDTNIAQLELLWLLAGDRRNILAVGDDDQAIYRFRGASFGSFTIFLERFCGVSAALPAAATKKALVSLSQNYRSTRRILRVAGEMISHNEKSPLLPLKNLTTGNPDGEKIRVVEFAAFEEEAHWVASEIGRLHEAGAAWRSFAVLYRKHTHRAQLLEALRHRGIPFVIRKFSILSSTLVRDLLAWMRLIAVPADNVACARVLAAPYWGLEPRDLVRLAERAEKNHRRPLWDEVESAHREPPLDREGVRLPELVQLLNQLRQSARSKTASALLAELVGSLGLVPLASEADRQYSDRLVEFVKEWERKNEAKQLRDFIEYLGYFDELDGDVQIEEELSEDAVQLMTVHAAKGLEFPHVFILRLSKSDFPSGARRPKFEFPPELMKEEQPKEDFHIQEERRLFYVALTRAQKRLTLSAIVNKRKKPSPFLDDFLMKAEIQKKDVAQSAPKIEVPLSEETAGPPPAPADPTRLFPATNDNSRAYSRVALWAKAFHPPRPEPLQLSASAIGAYEQCPMKYMFRHVWNIPGGPQAQLTFGNVMHRTIREFISEMSNRGKAPFEEVLAIYDREWSSTGFPDEYQEGEYRKAGREQLEAFHRSFTAAPAHVLYQEKGFELPLAHNVVVTGRMDQVNRLGDREIEIVDYKTGKVRDAKKAAEDLQLSIYALAAREVLDLTPGRLVLHYLVNNESVETTRDAKALAATKARIAEVADQIRAGDFSAKPGFACGYCDYKPLCPAHEQLISIQPAQAKD
jgi:ATP-dependent DNA helicase UvrD/PcrA